MVRYFINNRISAFMIAAALITSGVISLYRLPVSLVPAADYPAISIMIEYPGVGPEKIESLITKPVERIIRSVSGITEIESVSEDGKSRINVTFSEKTDIKIASVKLKEKIELISDAFPEEVQEPVVFRYDPSERPVVIAAVEIPGLSVEDVRDIADRRIKPALQRIEGISEVNIAGGAVKEIHVDADRSRMEARGITFEDISSAVKSSNISVPGGIVESGTGMNLLNIPSGFRSVSDIADTIVCTGENSTVYLKDIANTSFSSRERDDFSRYNGKDLVTVYIHKGSGANTLSVCRETLKVLDSFSDMKFRIIYNQGEYIESAVNNAGFSGIWGIFIVIAVLAVFLRRREAVIPIALSIPCSMFIVPLFLSAGGKGINIMTLSGFALSAGMVVDNGIVIIEAISSSKDKTIEGIQSAVNSLKTAVISSTLTTVSVFAPVAILSRRAESMYGDMAFTVNRALAVSLFTAIILVPAFYVTFKNTYRIKIPGFISGRFSAAMEVFEKRIIRLEENCFLFYNKTLNYAFTKSLKVISTASLVVFLSAVIYSVMDRDAVSDEGGREFYLYMEFPTGTSLDVTDHAVRGIELMVRETEGIESVSSKVEKWRGTLTVRLKSDSAGKNRKKLQAVIKEGADIYLEQFMAFSYISEADELASREVSIHFLGDDTDTLKKIAKEASKRIKSIDGISECYLRFREGRPEYCLSLDREKSGMCGVPALSVAERIRSGLFGPVITKFIEKDREIDVRVRLSPQDRDTIENIMSGTVKSANGGFIPLSGVLNLSGVEAATRIYRINGRRSLSVTAKLGDISLQESEYRIRKVIEQMGLPDEYSFEFDRKIREFREERAELIVSAAVSVILIYMILASLFESLFLPLLIMITIPPAAAGAIPVLFITGTKISLAVYMGFIMLAGIVVNNGILLIEPVNGKYHEGALTADNLEECLRRSSVQRFRPVMLTVTTTVLGMLPLLTSGGEGSSLWFPFALTVISGLVFSTIMTLAVFPLSGLFFFRRIIRSSRRLL